ncbi:aldehyde ferredoxin oxidoreductase family protein, partial [Thermodesulfobacteriota bacterium]
YLGKILWVDLSKNELKDEILEEELCRRFVGGYGIGARILYDRQKPGVDPLGADNTIGIITGPLTGTAAIGGSRYTLVGKSPLTGGWGDANSGGYFGPYLKFAGYDAVFVTGASEKPVYLLVNNGHPELHDAGHLWGKDCYETEDILISGLGRGVKVVCIGPAGEKMVRFASVMNDRGRAAGRAGLGAVLGSKKLKAIVVGGHMKVPVFDKQRLDDLRKKYRPLLTNTIDWLGNHGTAFVAAGSAHSGDSPVKNWGGIGVKDFPDVEALRAENITSLRVKKYACYGCPIGCGAHMKAGTEEYQYEAGSHRPEYETLAMLGSNCLNNNLHSIIKLNDMCNRYGLDTISTGAVLAFTMECWEKGLISGMDTDGIKMKWGNHRSMVAMTEKLANREGFGDIIADGVKMAAERIGKKSDEYAMHIQGQELPAHDPKHDYHWGLAYMLDPTPARHSQNAEIFKPMGEVVMKERKSFTDESKAYRTNMGLQHVVNSSGLCAFVYSCFPTVEAYAEFMAAVTGWDRSIEDLVPLGERILIMRQAFNLREGLNTARFEIPGRMLGNPPFKEGPLTDVKLDRSELLKTYFTAIGWDENTAKPKREKLLELGLEDLAQQLWDYAV